MVEKRNLYYYHADISQISSKLNQKDILCLSIGIWSFSRPWRLNSIMIITSENHLILHLKFSRQNIVEF